MIRNEISQDKLMQYQEPDHHEIMSYPQELRSQLFSSIFRNVKRKGMYVKSKTVKEHFKDGKVGNGKVGIGHGCFLKKIKDKYYAEAW